MTAAAHSQAVQECSYCAPASLPRGGHTSLSALTRCPNSALTLGWGLASSTIGQGSAEINLTYMVN